MVAVGVAEGVHIGDGVAVAGGGVGVLSAVAVGVVVGVGVMGDPQAICESISASIDASICQYRFFIHTPRRVYRLML